MAKKSTTESFISQSSAIHNNIYDYSLVDYIGCGKYITIICPIHGEFNQMPKHHLKGMGCQQCARKVVGLKTRNSSEDFISKATAVHSNKYDYSKVIFSGLRAKVIVICPEHGEFVVRATNHINGKTGCPSCYKDEHCWNTKSFVEHVSVLHNNFYDYSKTEFTDIRNKITIICSIHGDFKQTAGHHLLKFGCKKCNDSIGEKSIASWLTQNNIEFIREHSFEDCRSTKNEKYKLKFDFYLPKYNHVIEFDGLQHEQEIKHFSSESFEVTQRNDKVKNEYCLSNNIPLLRIKYKNKDKIDTILAQELYPIFVSNNSNKNKMKNAGKITMSIKSTFSNKVNAIINPSPKKGKSA